MSSHSYYITRIPQESSSLFSTNTGLSYTNPVAYTELNFSTPPVGRDLPPCQHSFVIDSIESAGNPGYVNEQIHYPSYSIYVYNAPNYYDQAMWMNPAVVNYTFAIDGIPFKLRKNTEHIYYTNTKQYTVGANNLRHYSLMLPDVPPAYNTILDQLTYATCPKYTRDSKQYLLLPNLYVVTPDMFMVLIPRARVQVPANSNSYSYKALVSNLMFPINFLGPSDIISISHFYKVQLNKPFLQIANSTYLTMGSKLHNSMFISITKNSYSTSSFILQYLNLETNVWTPFLTFNVLGNRMSVLNLLPSIPTVIDDVNMFDSSTNTTANGAVSLNLPHAYSITLFVENSSLCIFIDGTMVTSANPNPYYLKTVINIPFPKLLLNTQLTHSIIYDILESQKCIKANMASDATLEYAFTYYQPNVDSTNVNKPLPYHFPGPQRLLTSYEDTVPNSHLFVDEYVGLSDNTIDAAVAESKGLNADASLSEVLEYSRSLGRQLALARKAINIKQSPDDPVLSGLKDIYPTLLNLISMLNVNEVNTVLDIQSDVKVLQEAVKDNSDSIIDLYNRIKNIHPLVPPSFSKTTLPLINYSTPHQDYFLYNNNLYLPFVHSRLAPDDIITVTTSGDTPQLLYCVSSFDRLNGTITYLYDEDNVGNALIQGRLPYYKRYDLLFPLLPFKINVLNVPLICVDTSDKQLARSLLRDWLIISSTDECIGLVRSD